MRARPKQASIRFISVAICTFVLISNLQLFVLCIGQDGHVAIEVAGSDCCESLAVGVARTDLTAVDKGESAASNDDCSSCVDIPLSGGLADTPGIAKRASLFFLASAPVSPSHVETPQLSELQVALETSLLTPYFTPLRSIILLI
ncbi:MAG: hypothetical protein ACYSP9_02825 [Planctomycetota bacterium]|jgi:hypothetical protein